jgi:hypothetical protein
MNGGTGDYWWEDQADLGKGKGPNGEHVPLCWRCSEPKLEDNKECKGHPHD